MSLYAFISLLYKQLLQ